MMRTTEYLAAILMLSAASAMADAGDPPSRVARLNYQSGAVSFRPGSVEEWTAATLNYPLTSGDHLWTEDGAQTEMHIGSTAIRMSSRTALGILNLDDRTVQLSLTQGSLDVRLRSLGEDETFEVDTPNVAVSLVRPGEYRINVDGDNAISVVAVREGEAEVTGGDAAFSVRAGESARLIGMDAATQDIGAAPPRDDFDRWSEERDRREERPQSAQYVSREMTGSEDLDEYGTWREEAEYGWVWAPRTVAVGWAPYRYGHWAWVEPWGWTWVDDAPWGFAPFHYGRWAYFGGGWVWVPGTMVARPVYAPALVAFVGGPRFGVAVGIGGGVAWFPLGPREVYRPAYHVSEVYVQRVNVTHVTNVTVINNVNVTNVRYVNQNVQGAVTAVPRDAFVSARPVRDHAMAVNARDMAQAPVVGTTAQVAPERRSVLGQPDRGAAAAPPARYAERPVVARSAPAPPPVPFAAKQQALQANQGRPLDAATENRLRGNAPARAPMVRRVTPPQGGQPDSRRQAAPPIARPPQPPQPPPVTRENIPRNDRPQRPVQEPVRTPPPAAQQPPRPVERQVETPPRPAERRVEPPARPVERQVETPPRPAERKAEPPARPVERQVETPPRPAERKAEEPPKRGGEKKVEKKPDKKGERKDDKKGQ